MDYYDKFNYKNSFAPVQQNEEDSDIEMKDLDSLDEESVKVMKKNWNDNIKKRIYQEERDKETTPYKNSILDLIEEYLYLQNLKRLIMLNKTII